MPEMDDDWSPARTVYLGQDRIEPIILQAARDAGADIRFGCELLAFHSESNFVAAELKDRSSGQRFHVRARYLVAADGVKSSIREQLAILQSGRGTLGHNLAILFDVDNAEAAPAGFVSITHPEAAGVLVATDVPARYIYSIDYEPCRDRIERACARDEAGFGPEHANGWYELTWLEHGSAAYRIGGRQLVLRPGECLVLPPEVENTPWAQGVSVHQTWLAPELIAHAWEELRRCRPQTREPLVFWPDSALSALSRGLFLRAQEGWDCTDPGQAATIDAIAFALVAPERQRVFEASTLRNCERH
jgi:hypothetical protein